MQTKNKKRTVKEPEIIYSDIKPISKNELIQKVSNCDFSIDKSVAKLADQLHSFEKKYNLRSEIFYKIIVGTPAEDSPDLIEWAICYRSYSRVLQSKLSIEGVGIGIS